MSRTTVSLSWITLALITAAVSSNALAEGHWAKNHPRRHEVNARLNNQDRRIHNEVKEGEINKEQAHGLHAQDHAIRREERADAAGNGGHITQAQQRQLNRQENGVSKEIGK